MRLTLGANTCARNHGYLAALDRVGPEVDELTIDASAVRAIEPLAAVRIAMVVGAARARGCEIRFEEPEDPVARAVFRAYSMESPLKAGSVAEGSVGGVILPCTAFREFAEVDRIWELLTEPLIDHFADVAVVRHAVLMAFEELCQNAVEHGASPSGCVVAMARSFHDGIGKVSMGVGDLGVGIPDHIRRTQAEVVLDHHAIGRALEEGVSGVPGMLHRGYGFQWVLHEALLSAATAAEMVLKSGRGTFRRRIVDGRYHDHGWESPLVAGTWIVHEWTTVMGR